MSNAISAKNSTLWLIKTCRVRYAWSHARKFQAEVCHVGLLPGLGMSEYAWLRAVEAVSFPCTKLFLHPKHSIAIDDERVMKIVHADKCSDLSRGRPDHVIDSSFFIFAQPRK